MNKYKTGTKIIPHLDLENEILTFETVTSGLIKNHIKETIHFKDSEVRKALIKLGWTPPKDN